MEEMKKMKKQRKPLQRILLSFALVAALVIGGVPLDGHVLVSMAAVPVGTSTQSAIEIGTWEALKTALSEDGTKRTDESENTPTYFKLTADCTDSVSSSDSYIEVGQGRSVVLDLNSKTLDRGLSSQAPIENGQVIMIASGASLTVDDNSAGKQGKITGGNTNDDGGGVYIGDGAKSFALKGGNISGNKAELAAGGVMCVGDFTMNGGTISGNEAKEGAGVYVCSTSETFLCGGKITGNIAKGSGGGVGCDTYANISVSGSLIISGNTANKEKNNVDLYTSIPCVTVSGKLTEEAIIGFYYAMEGTDVVVASQDYNGGKLSADDLSHFVSDNPDYIVTLTEEGEGQLVKKASSSFKKEPVGKTGLIANGKSQELVTAGEAEGGTVYYAVTENNSEPNESAFSASVPKRTDAGTYYVWYIIKGDSSHTNVAAKNVTVKISPATIEVSGITLNKTSATIETGKTLQLSHTITPANATNKSVTYSSSNTKVATVNNSGLVTGVKAGTADITATAGGKSAVCKVTVKDPVIGVSGITLNKTSATIETGKTMQLSHTITPANATNKGLTYSSSNTDVATVNQSGLVTGVKAGSVTITAKTQDGGKEATCTVTIRNPEIAVTGVTLDKTTASIEVGKTTQLTATVSPDNASNKGVTWSSSDTGIATVSSSGLVTGLKAGSATITATTQHGGKQATCTVTVKTNTVKVTGVKLNKKSANVMKGKTLTLKATVSPSDASNKNVTWKSSNSKVATVSKKGVVKGIKAGTATITATTKDGSKKATCKITVNEIKSVKFAKKTYTVKKGQTTQLKITFNPKKPSNKEVTYKSSNKKIAKVDKNGKVTGVKKGTVSITVTTKDGKKTAKCTVTVK